VAQLSTLGDFTFMKIYRTLGILWLLFCGYGCFNFLRDLLALPGTTGLWPVWFVLAGFSLLDLAGIVASIFLYRGARWARWFVGLFAVFTALCDIANMVMARSLHTYTVCIIASVFVFATASVVLLFLPKHEPVA
jgi:hypothetical protein